MNERVFLWMAQVFYASSVLLTIRRLKGGHGASAEHRLNMALMLCGFALHTFFLYQRGRSLNRCPLTTLFEAQVFIAWAAVLFYVLIGHAYHVSFLGAFTAPLALAICLAALIVPIDVPHVGALNRSGWVEFHAAVAILAVGAFGLSSVAGAMYFLQERQLKRRQLTPMFLQMPPIEQLDIINFRLLVVGFAMLTVGMAGGIVSYRIVGHWTVPKIVWAVTVWGAYAAILAAWLWKSLRGRRAALVSMAAFGLLLASYWVVNLLPAATPS